MVFDAIAQDLEQYLIRYPYNVTADMKHLTDNLLAIVFAVQPFQNDIKWLPTPIWHYKTDTTIYLMVGKLS